MPASFPRCRPPADALKHRRFTRDEPETEGRAGPTLAVGGGVGVGFALLPRVRARDMIGPMPVTVLLIDDDPSFRQLARRTLAGTRMTVVGEADTAAAGARAARALKPEVVLVGRGICRTATA